MTYWAELHLESCQHVDYFRKLFHQILDWDPNVPSREGPANVSCKCLEYEAAGWCTVK